MDQYDAIIIGAGQAGGPLSTELAKAGWKIALIEREHVGGTCINEGCTPTKTMVASARVAYLARRAADYGVHAGPISIDMGVVRQRKRAIVESFRAGSERRIKQADVDLLFGEASFTGPKTLEVCLNNGDVRQITARTIFINTGEHPAQPAIEGIEQAPVLNSTSIMELDTVPEHLIVLGGGYVGLEFAQMFRRFGSQVTIVQRGAQLLAREDADVAAEVAKILREDGIDILLHAAATHVSQSPQGYIQLTIRTPEAEQIITGSHLLAATGRQPNTRHLKLAATSVHEDHRGYVQVNEKLETNVEGIYALGDVKGGPAFTHISYDDFRVIRTNLLEKGNVGIKDRLLIYTVFIDPQLGRVGLSETEARKQGRKIKVAKMPMNYVARALEVDESRGFMKAIIDAGSGQLLGAAILGIEGGELMSMLEIAMLGKLPYTVLRDAVFAHPTLAESLNNLFSSLD
jgi:pyruvate/2-oxoglutarate dehydrogenase complex dihydrolipoamide dehydrogenase (E3) component